MFRPPQNLTIFPRQNFFLGSVHVYVNAVKQHLEIKNKNYTK